MPSATEAARAYLAERSSAKSMSSDSSVQKKQTSKATEAARAYLESKKPVKKDVPKKEDIIKQKEEPKRAFGPDKNSIAAPSLPSGISPPKIDLGFGSSQSTIVLPSKEQVSAVESTVNPVVSAFRTVAAKAKELRTSQSVGARVVGALADSVINTGRDMISKLDAAAKKPTVPSVLDYGINGATLGVTDFIPEAAPEIIGAAAEGVVKRLPVAGKIVNPKKVGEVVQKGVQKGMEAIFGRFLQGAVGDVSIKAYEKAFGETTPEEQQQIRNVTTVGVLIGGFKGLSKAAEARGVRMEGMRDAGDLVHPTLETLGLKIETDKNGLPILPDEAAVNRAYKNSLEKAAADGGPNMKVKMDAYDSAKIMADDYRALGYQKFVEKWQPIFEQGSVLADRITSNIETKIDDAIVTKSAENVNKVLAGPATKESYREARNLSEREQLAFEQEIVDMNAKNDPKLSQAADAEGYNFDRIDDPFDGRPAHYDTQTGKISLNEPIIRSTLDAVWNDKVIRVGEGKLTTVFRKLRGESYEAMKTRYEQTLLKHEIAHAKTVTPEDAARLRIAVDTGNKKLEAQLRAELEEKASQYTIEEGNRLPESTNKAIDEGVREFQTYQETRSQLDMMKYEKTEMESSYNRWKKIVKNNPNLRNADFDQLEGTLKTRPAYKDAGAVKSIFEDALAKQDEMGPNSFDALLSEFQKRRSAEERILGEYKKARGSQAKLDLEPSKKDAEMREMIRREIKAEAEKQKLSGEKRALETGLLRERITRRLERRVMDERFAEVEKKLKGEKVNLSERAQTKIDKLKGKVFKERVAGRMKRDVLRERMEGQKQDLRTKAQTKREAQQLIVDFMRQNRVPKEVRVQAISGLKNARNPADVLKVVQEMRKNWNEFDRKQHIRDIRDIFKENSPELNRSGYKEGKMTAEAQRELNRIEEVSKLDRNELNKQIVQLVEDFRSKNPSTIALPDDVAAKMEILELGGLKGQTLQQLEATRDYIENLVERGKSERQSQLEMEKAKSRQVVEDAREYINGSPSEVLRTGVVSKDTLIARGKEQVKAFWRSGSILPEMAMKFGKGVESLVKKSISLENKAKAKALDAAQNMRKFMVETYGDKAPLLNSEMSKQTDLGEFTNANGQKTRIVLTKGQALDLYMKMQDSRARQAILENNGFTPEMLDKSFSLLTDADKKLGDYIIEKGYATPHDRLAAVYEYTRGVPFGKVDRYSGHLRYEGDPEATTFLDAALMDVSNRKRVGSPEFTKSRADGVKRQLRLSTDPVGDFLTYVNKAEHYVEMSEMAPRWSAILQDKTIRESIIEKHGQSAWDSFEYQVNNLLRGEPENIKASGPAKAVSAMSGNISGVLVRKPKVVAGQYASLAQFRSVARRGGAFWRGVWDAKKMRDMVYQYAPGVRLRIEGDATKVIRDTVGRKSSTGRTIQKLQDLTGRPLENADSWTTLRGAAGLFADRVETYQKRGMSLEESRAKAGEDVDSFIIQTQSTPNYLGKSQLELQPSVLQGFTNLRNQPNKVIHGNKVAFERFRKGDMTSKELATYLYWNNLVQPIAYGTLRYGAGVATSGALGAGLAAVGATSASEEQFKKLKNEDLKKNAIASILNTNLTGSFLVGDVAEMFINNLFFGKNYEIRPGVLQTLWDDFSRASQEWASGDIDEAGLLGIRSTSRMAGIPDPIDIIGMFLSTVSRANTEAKAEARKTPEARFEAAQKRRATKLEKALGK